MSNFVKKKDSLPKGAILHLLLQPKEITVTDYGFFAISPKGKVIKGITCFAYLSLLVFGFPF
jgi:hypothetical protein